MAAHRIDIQHHILPPDYVRIAGEERIGPLMVSGKTPPWSPELSLEAMERNAARLERKLAHAGVAGWGGRKAGSWSYEHWRTRSL